MTEAEWLACADPEPMLRVFAGTANDRKLRLFACACVRRIWHLLPPESQAGVEVSEQFADGAATVAERDAAVARSDAMALSVYDGGRSPDASAYATSSAVECAGEHAGTVPPATSAASTAASAAGLHAAETAAAERGNDDAYDRTNELGRSAEVTEQSKLVRDIFGNPFHQVTVDASWLTPNVVALARAIYERRAFHQMPELADALEDAGCTEKGILGHCRGPGPHVLGCWVVDLLLRKA
ncbi:MAG TPA: hypothetical protein VGI81_28785 [Tepidisphaeraceae bacterium]|jgi:hypothetical protein